MKKTRFFVASSALLLGVVSVFAAKPVKKFFVTSGTFKGNTGISITSLPGSTFTTTVQTNKTVFLMTVGSTYKLTLVTTGINHNRVYHL